MSTDRIILGIDPGTNLLGYGLIAVKERKAEYISMGVLDLRSERDHFVILRRIMFEVGALIEKYSPDELAIESLFYGKNVQVMHKLGRAQGAAIAAAIQRGLPIFEYAPKKIKMSITGSGSASKEQVAMILQKTLKCEFESEHLDASDALAIALCHYYQLTNPLLDRSISSTWEKFVESHPQRVKK